MVKRRNLDITGKRDGSSVKSVARCKGKGRLEYRVAAREPQGRFWKWAGVVFLAGVLAWPMHVMAGKECQAPVWKEGESVANQEVSWKVMALGQNQTPAFAYRNPRTNRKEKAVGQVLVKAREFGVFGEDEMEENGGRAERKLYHVHIGTAQEGTGCYKREVLHVHEGSPGKEGACYQAPVYHEHTGNEKEGGGCYGEADYHVHKGDETAGGVCYEEPVYHSHAGSPQAGGGCYGKEAYHKHTGDALAGGGCFGKPVNHSHAGSAATGGGCYGKPVYHSHTGNDGAGGGCYTVPVYHTHIGDSASGGNCYGAVYHTHTDGCYGFGECTVSFEGGLHIVDKQDANCPQHGLVQHVTFEGTFNHRNCKEEKVTETRTVCWTCRDMGYSHEYPKAVCGMEDAIEEYTLICGKEPGTAVDYWEKGCGQEEGAFVEYEINCGKDTLAAESYEINCGKTQQTVELYEVSCEKTEETVESYRLSCKKTEETVDAYSRNCGKGVEDVDAYALSCGKTEESVEGYELGCGREEGVPYAVFSLSKDSFGWSSQPVVLRAECENKDGFLRFSKEPFVWQENPMGEGAGSVSGGGIGENGPDGLASVYSVKENGVYTVRLQTENEDVDDRTPALSVTVKNIDTTPPRILDIVYDKEEGIAETELRLEAEDVQPDASPGSGLAAQAYSFDGGRTWSESNLHQVRENGLVEIAVRDMCGNVAGISLEIGNLKEEGGLGETGEGEDKEEGGEDADKEEGEDKEEEGEDKEEEGEDKEEEGGKDKEEGEGEDKDKEEEGGKDKEKGEENGKEEGEGEGADKEENKDKEEGEGNGTDEGEGEGEEEGKEEDIDKEAGEGESGDREEAEGEDKAEGSGDGIGKEEEGADKDKDREEEGWGSAGKEEGDGGTDKEKESGEREDGTDRGNGNDKISQGDKDRGEDAKESDKESGGENSSPDMESGFMERDKKEPFDKLEKTEQNKLLTLWNQPEKRRRKTKEEGEDKETGQQALPGDHADRMEIEAIPDAEEGEDGAKPEGKMEKEEVTVKPKEVNAVQVSQGKKGMMQTGAVVTPVVKAITFTMGGVAVAAGFLYFLYMLFRSIKVYHLDGEGTSHYAGSCLMKKTDNGFAVRLPDMMIEQSSTGQFALRPGSMFASRHKGQELIILAGERREAVWIDKEMPLKLVTFA